MLGAFAVGRCASGAFVAWLWSRAVEKGSRASSGPINGAVRGVVRWGVRRGTPRVGVHPSCEHERAPPLIEEGLGSRAALRACKRIFFRALRGSCRLLVVVKCVRPAQARQGGGGQRRRRPRSAFRRVGATSPCGRGPVGAPAGDERHPRPAESRPWGSRAGRRLGHGRARRRNGSFGPRGSRGSEPRAGL